MESDPTGWLGSSNLAKAQDNFLAASFELLWSKALQDILPPSATHLAQSGRIAECGTQSLCKSVHIVAWYDPTRRPFFDRQGHLSHIARDYRQAGLHCLMHGDAKSLSPRWLQVQV